MSYTSEEYSKMRFRVMDFESNLYSNIPEIKIYKEFQTLYSIKSLKFDILFKYIALIHDYNSPLHVESDLKKRKVEAANLAGMPKGKDEEFLKPYMDVIRNSGEFSVIVNKAIIRYARLQNDSGFLLLAAYEETMLNNTATLLETKDQKEQKVLLDNIESISEALERLRKKFLIDESALLYSELLEEISNHNLELFPEQLILKEDARNRILKQGNIYGEYTKEWYGLNDLSNEEFKQLYRELTNDTDEAREHFAALNLSTEGEISIKKNKAVIDRVLHKQISKRKL